MKYKPTDWEEEARKRSDDSEEKGILEDMDAEEIKELGEAAEELLKNPIKGWKKAFSSMLKPLRKRDRVEATYFTFKPIFKHAGMKFTRKDAETVRTNMLRLAEKLDEVHKQQVDEIDAELEKKNG